MGEAHFAIILGTIWISFRWVNGRFRNILELAEGENFGASGHAPTQEGSTIGPTMLCAGAIQIAAWSVFFV